MSASDEEEPLQKTYHSSKQVFDDFERYLVENASSKEKVDSKSNPIKKGETKTRKSPQRSGTATQSKESATTEVSHKQQTIGSTTKNNSESVFGR